MVGDREHARDILIDDEDGQSEIAVELGQGREDLPANERGQSERSLIDDQKSGTGKQARADSQHLPLTA